MAGSTIEFTQRASGTFFTIAEINQLFADIATVLNQKLDVRTPAMTANLQANGQRVINVADAVDPDDLINFGQLKQLLGIA